MTYFKYLSLAIFSITLSLPTFGYDFEIGADFSRLVIGTVTGKDIPNDDSFSGSIRFYEHHVLGLTLSSLLKDNDQATEDGEEIEIEYRYFFTDEVKKVNIFIGTSVGILSYEFNDYSISGTPASNFTTGEMKGKSLEVMGGVGYRLTEKLD